MLRELLIKNFAIIDDLNIRFEDGLTILSGETGAGKSIIINAVNLLLGARASARMIRDGCDAAELSAFFDISDHAAASAIMRENGYDPEAGLLVRRVIATNDRHRVYINDRMATMQMLSSITADLASISGQHANQGLLKEDTHLAILDRFGGLLPLARKVETAFAEVVPLVQRLEALKQKKEHQEQALDLLHYQAAEIADAAILADEDEALEKERLRLRSVETLQQTVHAAIASLHGADGAVLERLGETRKGLEKAAELDGTLSPGVDALSDHLFGLEDIVDTLRSYLSTLESEPGRLEAVEERLDLINRLKRKHGGSLEALFRRRDAIALELDAVSHLDDEIAATETRLRERHAELVDLACQLSDARRRAAADFCRSVETELAGLKMEGTRFDIDFSHPPCGSQTPAWFCLEGRLLSATGIDTAAFMIAPNVGESLKPLAAIASGGELSRVVLALKAILAETDAVGTVIFDEVDAGIGGGVADVVGRKLKSLARKHQILCITHLPQIARCGKHHYHIQKQVRGGRTTTTIRPMDETARIEEIARMLGGEKITATARKHAKALLAS